MNFQVEVGGSGQPLGATLLVRKLGEASANAYKDFWGDSMTVYVIVVVYRGVCDSVEAFLSEVEANSRLAKLRKENDNDDYDISLHTCL